MQTQTTTKAILVTGASSGIGHAIALYMAQHGFVTFATVRKTADAEKLRQMGIPTLVPICPLDLSKPEEIKQAAQTVREELQRRSIKGLYGVVSNAGGGGIAPIELMDIRQFRTETEARLVGPVALLQELLPLIREAQGRLIWIVTPSLMPIPLVASIHACDFAANCLARTLQIELKPWNIPVVQIRCGGIRTASSEKSTHELSEFIRSLSPEQDALYGDTLRKELNFQTGFDKNRTEPERVAALVHKALSVARPRRRYQIGHMSRIAQFVEYLPQPLIDRLMEARA